MAWTALRVACCVLALAPLVYYVVALIAAWRFFPSSAHPADLTQEPVRPVSLLKPIYGLDRETYENYASFCNLAYAEYEILFCVSDDHDPAIPVIRKLMADFPNRDIRLLVGSERLGVSDKVNKLCRMAREARHDILVVTDSDVRVAPQFLSPIVAAFQRSEIGAVTCLYRGLTDGGFAANLEALGNSTDFAAGVLVSWLFAPVNFMLGACMATTKKHLAEIGGFESMVDYFSDDYELGNRIAANGHRVELIPQAVSIVYPHQTLGEAFRHQLRWNLSIRFSRPGGHVGLLFTQAFPLAILGALAAPSFWPSVAFLAAYIILRFAAAWAIGIRGMRDHLVRRQFWLLPVRDAFAFIVWLASFFPQRIFWRGQQFQVRDKKLVAVPPGKS
jgi:ceramide glucosyltransferase